MNEVQLVEILKNKSLKVTSKRTAILNVLVTSKLPLTIVAITDLLPTGIQVDTVTIYRTMQTLVEAGMVREYALKKGVTHYEYKNGHSHHHLVCTDCGVIEDFTICAANDISKQVLTASKKFRVITSHNFELFGLCKVCSK
jgi:Fur family transcriptional regulator, ferric uptake regulator